MVNFWVTLIGAWAVWFAYNISVTKGKHRRKKRGVFDYADGKWRRDMMELVHRDRGKWGAVWGQGVGG